MNIRNIIEWTLAYAIALAVALVWLGSLAFTILFGAALVNGQDHTTSPHAYAGVDAGTKAIRVTGENSRLLVAADAAGARFMYAETRDAARTSFGSYEPLRMVAGGPGVSVTSEYAWHLDFSGGTSADITPAEWRFGNGNAWSDWYTLPDRTQGVRTPELHAEMRALGFTLGRYESYGVAPDPNAIVQQPPTEFLTKRLQELPGGIYTAVFLVPMIAAAFSLSATRSPAILLIVIGGSMAITIFLVEASPFALALPLLFAASGALLGVQFGWTRQFGGK